MSRRGLLIFIAALAVWAAWTVYARGTGSSAADTSSTSEQCAACPTPVCDPAGCCGGCAVCPTFVDQDKDGVCDTAGRCAKPASTECCGPKNCCGQWPTVLVQREVQGGN
jgi:hypothetical protein